jgi:hypothetical protein
MVPRSSCSSTVCPSNPRQPFRSDIASLFPGWRARTARSARTIDDELANGLHTIAWSVTDSLGAATGIGSPFSVSNGASLTDQGAASLEPPPIRDAIDGEIGAVARRRSVPVGRKVESPHAVPTSCSGESSNSPP